MFLSVENMYFHFSLFCCRFRHSWNFSGKRKHLCEKSELCFLFLERVHWQSADVRYVNWESFPWRFDNVIEEFMNIVSLFKAAIFSELVSLSVFKHSTQVAYAIYWLAYLSISTNRNHYHTLRNRHYTFNAFNVYEFYCNQSRKGLRVSRNRRF